LSLQASDIGYDYKHDQHCGRCPSHGGGGGGSGGGGGNEHQQC